MRMTYIICGIEWLLICLMAFCGCFTFVNSNVYAGLQSLITSHYPGISPYLPEILWGIIFLFGFQSVILRKKGGGSLAWLAVIASIPSLLTFDTIKLSNLLGLNFKLATRLGFYELLSLEILIMIGYLVLNYMSVFKQSRLNLIKRKADPDDTEEINSQSQIFLFLATATALATVAIVVLIARGLEALLLPLMDCFSWNAVLIGLGCILILAIYLYWFGSQRRSNT